MTLFFLSFLSTLKVLKSGKRTPLLFLCVSKNVKPSRVEDIIFSVIAFIYGLWTRIHLWVIKEKEKKVPKSQRYALYILNHLLSWLVEKATHTNRIRVVGVGSFLSSFVEFIMIQFLPFGSFTLRGFKSQPFNSRSVWQNHNQCRKNS